MPNQPPKNPADEPPNEPPKSEPTGRKVREANLNRGLSANQEKGADGKIRRKQSPPKEPESPKKPKGGGTWDEAGISPRLSAMRFVLEEDEACDDTPLRKAMRELRRDDLKGFMDRLERREQEHAAGGEATDEEAGTDAGEEKVLALIEEILGEADGK